MSSLETVYKPSAQRFKSGIEYQKSLLNLTRTIQQNLLNDLPSNYSKDQNTNLAEFFRSVAKEFARLQIASSDVNEDIFHSETKAEYLFQILGDSLFLGNKAINESLDDISYRNFLIKVRNAYFKGSRKSNIQDSVSDIIGIPVTIKEVYLNLREENTSYTLEDTHKMFFDILMDDADTSSIGLILEDIKYFIDVIKPAHVIYDTRLIWEDQFLNTEGNCKPSYITLNMEYEVYSASLLYKITFLASSVYKVDQEYPEETWSSGTISSVDSDSGIFHLTDDTILVYNSNTLFYSREDGEDSLISVLLFEAGDEIKYYATEDSSSSSDIIDDTWEYSGTIMDLYPDEELVQLSDGSLIVYNTETYVYTRDYNGEYRINVSDLIIGNVLKFKAERYIRNFQFYQTPEEVTDNFFKQFDPEVIAKPTFQEYVLKNKAIPDGYTEGYHVVIEDGVAVIKNITSKFYKREDEVNYKEEKIQEYNLYIDDTYVNQFQVTNPQRSLTIKEAKDVFIYDMGYTGLQDPETDYNITINKTGVLEVADSDASIVQAIGTQTELCDQRASCNLLNFYEDTRKYFVWPDPQLTSGIFNITHAFDLSSPPEGAYDIGAWFEISSDLNTYTMPLLPMLNSSGGIATTNDIVVYLSGRIITNSVTYLDPWNGIVGLNFIPPFNTTLRIDYYYAKRYPEQVYYLKQIRDNIPASNPEDLPAIFTAIGIDSIVPRLTWPFSVSSDLYGDNLDYQMDKFPILSQKGELASASDITVEVGTPVISGTVRVIEIDTTAGTSTLQSISGDWVNVEDGDLIVLIIPNYLDNTHIYTIESVDTVSDICIVPNILPLLLAEYEYTIIKFLEQTDAVTDVRSLFGHIRINFLPPVNSYIRFNYYYTSQKRNYLMVPDAPVVTSSELYSSSYFIPDTVYNSVNRYTMLVDQKADLWEDPYWDFDELLKIGYRYRAFSLSNSTIINSEKFLLNDYDRNTGNASFNYGHSNLNRFGLIYSPEYLTDQDKSIVLNDQYLTKDITPVTILNPDIPIFEKTYTDDGHHKTFLLPVEEDTYDPDLDDGLDIRGAFNIIEVDDSGIIDYNSICEFPEKEKINLYSDLKIVEHDNSGYDAPLTTIDDAGNSIPFEFVFIDQYYPDREMRVTDYLDFINQVPTDIKYGEIYVLKGSAVIKSNTVNFYSLNIGDLITIHDVPMMIWVGTIDTGSWQTVYKDFDYTLIEVIDFETGRFSKPYKETSGKYNYTLTRSKTYAVDVGLAGGYGETGCIYGNLNRLLYLNNSLGFNYGLTGIQASIYPSDYSLSFPDPDPDPYPRNPDNPWIGHPDVSYYDIEPYIIDSETYITNRTLGVTGIVNTSYIIDAEGESYGYTGSVGVTGPSGSLNLGITGPVEYPDPRDLADYDTYMIPSGYTGIYVSYSESEYRVQWRNFDQNIILVTLDPSGIFEEDPLNMMDDIGDNIFMGFWNVNTGSLQEIRFSGTLITSTEMVSASQPATSYTDGLIMLNADQVDAIRRSSDPVVDLPQYHLNDTNYQINRMIVRELLGDNLMKVTEIRQMVIIA